MIAVRNNPLLKISTNGDLGLGEKLLLIILAVDKGNLRQWTNKSIGAQIGVNATTLSRYLSNLESLGYIEITYFMEQGHTFRNIEIIKI
jgi:DNA-binding MarR family transcriptional regulator